MKSALEFKLDSLEKELFPHITDPAMLKLKKRYREDQLLLCQRKKELENLEKEILACKSRLKKRPLRDNKIMETLKEVRTNLPNISSPLVNIISGYDKSEKSELETLRWNRKLFIIAIGDLETKIRRLEQRFVNNEPLSEESHSMLEIINRKLNRL